MLRMPEKWVYRLEAVSPNKGLWYNEAGEKVWNIGEIESCKTKDLPMDYDWRYHIYGWNWHSACTRIEDLAHWYSLEDALELISNGFIFTKYLATQYYEWEFETTFMKETCLKREIIDIKEIWGE